MLLAHDLHLGAPAFHPLLGENGGPLLPKRQGPPSAVLYPCLRVRLPGHWALPDTRLAAPSQPEEQPVSKRGDQLLPLIRQSERGGS